MRKSRHVDFLQRFTDLQDSLIRKVSKVASVPGGTEAVPRLLYQDRLADSQKRLDREISYALGTLLSEGGVPHGVVLIAFRNERLNRGIMGKLAKGALITVFFVALIVVQNILSRRSKLRMKALEEALAAAASAIRGTLPKTLTSKLGELGIAFHQAEHVGGTVYDVIVSEVDQREQIDVLLAVPVGRGVEAAFAAVVMQDLFRRIHRPGAPLIEELQGLLLAYGDSSHARKVDLLLLRIEECWVSGISAGILPPLLTKEEAATVEVPETTEIAALAGADFLREPPRHFQVSADSRLYVFSDGITLTTQQAQAPRFAPAEHLTRGIPSDTAEEEAEAFLAKARRLYGKAHKDDLFALVFRRAPPVPDPDQA